MCLQTPTLSIVMCFQTPPSFSKGVSELSEGPNFLRPTDTRKLFIESPIRNILYSAEITFYDSYDIKKENLYFGKKSNSSFLIHKTEPYFLHFIHVVVRPPRGRNVVHDQPGADWVRPGGGGAGVGAPLLAWVKNDSRVKKKLLQRYFWISTNTTIFNNF